VQIYKKRKSITFLTRNINQYRRSYFKSETMHQLNSILRKISQTNYLLLNSVFINSIAAFAIFSSGKKFQNNSNQFLK